VALRATPLLLQIFDRGQGDNVAKRVPLAHSDLQGVRGTASPEILFSQKALQSPIIVIKFLQARQVRRVKIITNNPTVSGKFDCMYQCSDVMGVFVAVRGEVHLGATILSHPLSGSIKPWQTPYKSVVLGTQRGDVDMKSLQLIEDAIATLAKRGKSYDWDERMLEDFAVIDLDLIISAMESLT